MAHGGSNMCEPINFFTTDVPSWRPRISPLQIEDASTEQLEFLRGTSSNTKIGDFTRVLALEYETLLPLTRLISGIMLGQGGLSRPETELGAVSASVVNRSFYCAAAHSHQYNLLTKNDTVMDSILSLRESTDFSPRKEALFHFASKLSQSPPEGIKADMVRLLDNGLNMEEILDLVLTVSLFGWVNRLSQVLGDPFPQN